MSFVLRIRTADAGAIADKYTLRPNHADDAGVDLFCPERVTVPPRGMAKVDLKVQAALFKEGEGWGAPYSTPRAYMLVPRSSIKNTPLRLANSVGIIDAGYRGNLIAFVDNVSDQEYMINEGDRLFQIVGPSMKPMRVEVVEALDTTARGADGFGSTGVN